MMFCLQCTFGGVTIDCDFRAEIENSKKSSLSDSLQTPYVFKNGLLGLMFGSTVALWLQQATAAYYAAQQTIARSSAFSSVTVQVPSRFVTQLGNPIPVEAFGAAIEAVTGLAANNTFAVMVCEISG